MKSQRLKKLNKEKFTTIMMTPMDIDADEAASRVFHYLKIK